MRSALGICCLVLATALGIASCGDSGPSTEEEVQEAVVKAIESKDPKAFCRTLVSDHYLEMVYGDVQACLDSNESAADDPGQVQATAVALDPKDETRAEVKLTIQGGDHDGAAGHVEMAEEEDGWKLDDFGDDYLRSTFIAEIATVDEGVVAIPSMKVCFRRQVKTLDTATLRDLTFTNSRGDVGKTNEKLLKLAEHCPKGLAEYGAWEITQGLEESGKRSPAFVKCIREEVTAFLLLTEITPELLKEHPGFAAVAAFEGIVVGAKKNCLKTLHGD